MKKIILLGLMGLMGIMGAHAQFDDYGIKGAIGTATLVDDLSTKSPILGVNAGCYLNYTFKHSPTALSEIFYLQTGINFVRRGNSFQEHYEHDNTLSFREGYHHIYYVQVPVLAGLHFELPIREVGHIVGIYLGPAVSFGLFGRYADRMITPSYTSRAANYDVNFSGTPADRYLFNHIRRLDVSAILGLSYEHGRYTYSLFVDHGFIAVSEGTDVLRNIVNSLGNTNTNANDIPNIPDGNNNAVMFSVAYKLGSFMK